MIDMAENRATRFEVRMIEVGPNQVTLTCVERASGHWVAPLDVHQSAFTDDEMRQLHAAFALLEEKFGPVLDAYVGNPARMLELLSQARQAETRKAQLEKDAERIAAERDALVQDVTTLEERGRLAAVEASKLAALAAERARADAELAETAAARDAAKAEADAEKERAAAERTRLAAIEAHKAQAEDAIRALAIETARLEERKAKLVADVERAEKKGAPTP